jgi:hypothetical protein
MQTKLKQVNSNYTFKINSSGAASKKKLDPVSLFQMTSQIWKKNKFLKSQGGNKEGRKLDLDKRNKNTQLL